MSRVSPEEINNYINSTRALCSYKYILLLSLIRSADENQNAEINTVEECFETFYRLRENMNLLAENYEKCNPLGSNYIKKTLTTPLYIFIKEGFISMDEQNNLINIHFEINEHTVEMLELKIIDYFKESCFDEPDDIRELIKIWQYKTSEKFHQTEKQAEYEKIYLSLYDKTFIFEKTSKNLKARMQVSYSETSGPLFITLKNSEIDEIENPQSDFDFKESHQTSSLHDLREKLKESDKLRLKDGKWILMENCEFTSPSGASQFIAGTTSNGRIDWKQEDTLSMRLKDIIEMEEKLPAKFRFLTKKFYISGAGGLMTFLIDKWNGMATNGNSDSSTRNIINYKYFLNFYEKFNHPLYDKYKGYENTRRYRFYNFLTKNYASSDTLADYRKPRNYGCIASIEERASCDNTECKYYEETRHPCNKSKGLIWFASDQAEQDYMFSKNYLRTIRNDILNNEKMDFDLLYTIIYFFIERKKSNKDRYDQFIDDFSFTENEFDQLFKHSTEYYDEQSVEDQDEQAGISINNINNDQEEEEANSYFQLRQDTEYIDVDESFEDLYDSSGNDIINNIRSALEIKKQIILMGPPGTSKTYIAKQIAIRTAGKQENIEIVQFHPSYSYEDFVECNIIEGSGGQDLLHFTPKPKIFRRICDRAEKLRKDKERFVLIIDEINRGNVEQIFGELIYALENRGKPVKTTYMEEPLIIPDNLYIIATMNTVDLSIANIDAAIRRRFYILELEPDIDLLKNWLKNSLPDGEKYKKLIENIEK
ncbi:MAG: DUF4357 domain-containing protein, partial [Candidatus Lokiarchaeota archaeon]|nr:DUF4357 domain-containing protein [Candidatus Lokiarchaeota archaeon]